ncbi:MAG: hypothetical protein M3405_13250 [Acidobacteriota bacterium]|jgi:hypothetical protein|nr:hypothetical protein [Acidobacteriota bacterium]
MLNKLQKLPAKRLIGATVRNVRPSHLNLWRKDLLDRRRKPNLTAVHLRETFEWLKNAHDVCDGRGVAGGYSVIDGWLAPYPETTGYIIPTFYNYSEWTGVDDWW